MFEALCSIEIMKKIHRYPSNLEGDFYTTGSKDCDGNWYGDCLDCGLPENEAPNLFAPMDDDHVATYFIKQPETEEELQRAIASTEVCCTDAVRYGGKNKKILAQLHPDVCDYKINVLGMVVVNKEALEKFGE